MTHTEFGNSKTAERLSKQINLISLERKRLKIHRKISTLISRYNNGINEISTLSSNIIANELTLLWRKSYEELVRKCFFDKDIEDRVIGLIRERSRELLSDIKVDIEVEKKCNRILSKVKSINNRN